MFSSIISSEVGFSSMEWKSVLKAAFLIWISSCWLSPSPAESPPLLDSCLFWKCSSASPRRGRRTSWQSIQQTIMIWTKKPKCDMFKLLRLANKTISVRFWEWQWRWQEWHYQLKVWFNGRFSPGDSWGNAQGVFGINNKQTNRQTNTNIFLAPAIPLTVMIQTHSGMQVGCCQGHERLILNISWQNSRF